MDDDLDGLLATARTAYARGDWHAAYRQLTQARELSELEPGDLSLLGRAAWWLGQIKESLEVSEDVYHRFLDDGDASDAA
ncbi:MAG TPA: LuxR family transcriptional regulator, partial [Arthrobacter sp.]|nr:LuxR family transcriptional regulator [Arthrobacter sp.]